MTFVMLVIAYVLSVLWARVALRKFISPLPPTMTDVVVTILPIINLFLAIVITFSRTGGKFARKYFGIKER